MCCPYYLYVIVIVIGLGMIFRGDVALNPPRQFCINNDLLQIRGMDWPGEIEGAWNT